MDKLNNDILATIKQAYNLTDREHKQVLQLYKDSKDNIQQFIADLFARYGSDGLLNYDTYLRNYSHETEAYLIEETRKIAELETAVIAVVLADVLNDTYYKSAYHIERNLRVGVNFKLLRPEFISTTINYNWSGIPFSERIWGNAEHLVKSLRQELAQGLQAGESVDKMARRINKQFNRKAFESKRLMRTESARVITAASEQIYEDSGVVELVMWMATLENNTCDECGALDGKRFRLDDKNKPQIPAHPNCRCALSPVPYDEYEPSVRRDNETKEIIKYQTYEQWKKSKGIS